ncbi:conserved hypothetical protein [Desulfovibrionales bacterium]
MVFNLAFLEILACPKCKNSLIITPAEDGLTCAICGIVYPIKDDIPIMLIEEAISQTEWDEGKRPA